MMRSPAENGTPARGAAPQPSLRPVSSTSSHILSWSEAHIASPHGLDLLVADLLTTCPHRRSATSAPAKGMSEERRSPAPDSRTYDSVGKVPGLEGARQRNQEGSSYCEPIRIE